MELRKIVSLAVAPVVIWASLLKEADYEVERYIADSLDIPISFLYSERFQDFYKKRYQKKESFLATQSVQSYFIPMLDNILYKERVPEIFLFMAMAESNFASHARSSKAAVGMWQFMPKTAKKYGLLINRYVDERKDPVKSTKAAARYLKYLYGLFGKWYLAALAYNAGEGKVKRAIKEAGSDNIFLLLDPQKKYLPKESRDYLYKIVSLAKLSYEFDSKMSREITYILSKENENRLGILGIKGIQALDDIARAARMRLSTLKSFNPHFLRGFTPPKGKYSLYLPQEKMAVFRKNFRPARLYEDFVVHRVKKGDSLIKIARHYKVLVEDIKKFNKMRGSIIRVGQRLVIPVRKRKKEKTIYKVRPGDTLIKIARRFGVDPKQLKAWNKKETNIIKVGEKLVVINN
jgi:membrane-bound lytic murein transglycosylase D